MNNLSDLSLEYSLYSQEKELFSDNVLKEKDVRAAATRLASKQNLGFTFTVENHYFSLSEMAELSEKVIPTLQMDFAFLVVHAHESRLSINDGRGYTKLYRAVLQATGRNRRAFACVIPQAAQT